MRPLMIRLTNKYQIPGKTIHFQRSIFIESEKVEK